MISCFMASLAKVPLRLELSPHPLHMVPPPPSWRNHPKTGWPAANSCPATWSSSSSSCHRALVVATPLFTVFRLQFRGDQYTCQSLDDQRLPQKISVGHTEFISPVGDPETLAVQHYLFGPIYLDLSILTCFFGPLYLTQASWIRLVGPLYLDWSLQKGTWIYRNGQTRQKPTKLSKMDIQGPRGTEKEQNYAETERTVRNRQKDAETSRNRQIQTATNKNSPKRTKIYGTGQTQTQADRNTK